MEKPEILAPAGSMEALRAALSAGADAVYIGGSAFGARAYAKNPDAEELSEAIKYVHLRGKRLYLTVNTLLKEREFGALYRFLAPYYAQGLDAAIVQDVGVLRFLAREFPALSLHASTQMTFTGAKGLAVFDGYPVTRLVPARELSLEELRETCTTCGREVEIFIHGALCYCYSGQCLMSSLLGGRSGNRGRCAQPCRMEYEGAGKGKKYWLSPKDLCGLALLPELIRTGAASFKIEGRMKRPEYVAAVTDVYRRFTDLYFTLGEAGYQAYLKERPGLLEEEAVRLADVYNRGGFSSGCFTCHNSAGIMSVNRPGHFGVPVGEVSSGGKGVAEIRLKRDVNAQDVLEFRREKTKESTGTPGYYEYTVGSGAASGAKLVARLPQRLSAEAGDKVYRIRNNALLKHLEETYLEREKKQPADGVFYAKAGEVCTLRLSTRCEGVLPPAAFPERNTSEVSVCQEGFLCERAGKLPAMEVSVRKQLDKTGNGPFFFEHLEIRLADDVFLPNGLLNELRRTALEELARAVQAQYARKLPEKAGSEEVSAKADGAAEKAHPLPEERVYAPVTEDRQEMEGLPGDKPYLDCVVSNRAQAEAAGREERVRRVYLDFDLRSKEEEKAFYAAAEGLRASGKKVWATLPRICRKETLFRLAGELPALQRSVDGYLVRNYEALSFLMESEPYWRERVCLDYNMYVMNRAAKAFYRELSGRSTGVCTAPVELSAKELSELSVSDMTLVVYGRLPFMVSAHCIRKTMGLCQGKEATEREPVILTDRQGKHLPVKQYCMDCYNVVYNPECLSLLGEEKDLASLKPWALRADFTFETPEEVARILRSAAGRAPALCKEGYTRGHFRRGVE